jgi:hypothetical protein
MKKVKTMYVPPKISMWTAAFLLGVLAAIGLFVTHIYIAATLGIVGMGAPSWMGYSVAWAFVVAFVGYGLASIIEAVSPKNIPVPEEGPRFTRKLYARR